ncbi:hypothetical protein Ares1_0076 [Vibrio phage Ares1]|nr:hypothetical protein Ares1_0076 [Vibrio phage Ares1]
MYDRNDERFYIQPISYLNTEGGVSYEAMTAEFGDGLNRINTTLFEDKVGILIFRNTELEPGLALDIEKGDTVPNPKPGENAIALNFHTLQSIDAAIGRLQYIREVFIEREEAAKKGKAPEAGDDCPTEDCEGILEHYPDDCQCAVVPPPCAACTNAPLSCCVCGWSEEDE